MTAFSFTPDRLRAGPSVLYPKISAAAFLADQATFIPVAGKLAHSDGCLFVAHPDLRINEDILIGLRSSIGLAPAMRQPSIEAATAQPVKASSQWLSGLLGKSVHS